MNQPAPFTSWQRPLLAGIGLALLTLALCYALAPRSLAAAPQAQTGTLRLEISKRLLGSDVIQVGQLLTFTIRIANTGSISVTTLPLVDTYESDILELVRTAPLSSTNIVTPSTGDGLITWTDLTTTTQFGPLRPGQTIEVLTVFRAIAPRVATVNRAQIGAALGWNGEQYGGEGDDSAGDAIGGQVIVRKEVLSGTLASGLPLTFTVTISNDGAADLTRVPLRDFYDPTVLQFWRARPPPTFSATGELSWTDVLTGLGLTRLRPGEAVTLTTVFTALRPIDPAIINRVEAVGVRDEFGDSVEVPRQAEVPIRIIPGPSQPSPVPTERPRERRTATPEAPTPTSLPVTATLTSVPTPTGDLTATVVPTDAATPTPAPLPEALPRTGGDAASGWLLAAAALLVAAALAAMAQARR